MGAYVFLSLERANPNRNANADEYMKKSNPIAPDIMATASLACRVRSIDGDIFSRDRYGDITGELIER